MAKGKGKDPQPKPAKQPDLGQAAVSSNAAIAALAMKGATPGQKLVVYVCYGIILLGIVALGIPPYEQAKVFVALPCVLVALLAVSFWTLPRYRELGQGRDEPRTIRLSDFMRDGIRDILENARREAFSFLQKLQPALSDEQIRANIFFPEYGSPGRWDDYTLKIWPGLHLKMERPEELGISLKPEQGLTGYVFHSGKSAVAQRLESKNAVGGWDKVYQISDELAAIIHPALKWIISMPLNGSDGKPFGVMNVDGLVHDFKLDMLYDCSKKLTIFAPLISAAIQGK
jgi:hypothetical protein